MELKSDLLFLHGMLGSHRYWDGLLPLIDAGRKLILVDLLGFGESPKPKLQYTVHEHVDFIEKKVDEVKKDQVPLIVIGHSMGGLLSLNFAIANPGKVEKIILINAPMITSEQNLKKAIADSSSKLMVTMTFDKTWGQLVCHIHERFPKLTYYLIRLFEPHLPATMAMAAVQHTYNSYVGTFENVLLHQDFYKLLDQIQNIPVLILASLKDEYTKDNALERLPQRKNIKLIRIPGMHNVLLSDPSCIAAEINKFIATDAE